MLVDARPLCPACAEAALSAGALRHADRGPPETPQQPEIAASMSPWAGAPAVVTPPAESGPERPRFQVRVAAEPAATPLARFFTEAGEWCGGRLWWPRLLLLLWFLAVFRNLLRDPLGWVLIDGLNLGIHELGHYAFFWFGEFASILGGSLLECIAPIGAAIMFYRQRDYFAIAVASCWLGTALFDVGSYAGDARARDLPLVSPTSSDPVHDWFYILSRLDLLPYDHTIESLLHLAGATAMVAGLLFGGWLVLRMKHTRTS